MVPWHTGLVSTGCCSSGAMTPLLQVRDVSCATDNDHTIFSKIDFDVNEGDVIILQGKSGSGYVTV